MIKKIFNKIKLMFFLFSNKYKLKNRTPTILCNNCVAGIIYHELGLEFKSPTINLYINKHDFIKFINNLDEYSKSPLIQDFSSTEKFPVGILQNKQLGNISINFMHYSSFQEAKEKWIRRFKRIQKNNIYIILDIGPIVDKNILKQFHKLPFKNKIALVPCNINDINCYGISCYNENWHPGQILEYNKKTGKRYLHEWNYVKFLNTCNSEYKESFFIKFKNFIFRILHINN